jgi:SagB-type dehydrogenase family enzyme
MIQNQGLRTQTIGQSRDIDSLYEIFHENTKFHPNFDLANFIRITKYQQEPRAVKETAHNYKKYRFAPKIKLPDPRPPQAELSAVLMSRSSLKPEKGEVLTMDEVSSFLKYSAGIQKKMRSVLLPDLKMYRRPFPSSGGLYPVEIYPILLKTEYGTSVVTHYDFIEHELGILPRPLQPEEARIALGMSPEVWEKTGMVIVLTATFQRTTTKYGNRGYRMALLDVGHVSQSMLLVAEALGIRSNCWAGYFDDKVNDILDVNGVEETIIHQIILGK